MAFAQSQQQTSPFFARLRCLIITPSLFAIIISNHTSFRDAFLRRDPRRALLGRIKSIIQFKPACASAIANHLHTSALPGTISVFISLRLKRHVATGKKGGNKGFCGRFPISTPMAKRHNNHVRTWSGRGHVVFGAVSTFIFHVAHPPPQTRSPKPTGLCPTRSRAWRSGCPTAPGRRLLP